MSETRRRATAALLYAAVISIVSALPGGLLLTAPNFILVLTLFVVTWTTLARRGLLTVLVMLTAGLTVASVPASSAVSWWLGGGVDDLAALMQGPSVSVSTVIALTSFTIATVFLRRTDGPRARHVSR
ncbi:hypothetical protein GCM10009846_00540 [Agrococcus versicolor]|uniref:Histidine kinase n=1 Tax=Agrococcus versicolor TaxID=501482 RepID=A0ABN3AIZ2_9MICO